jgi:hypothetical protein
MYPLHGVHKISKQWEGSVWTTVSPSEVAIQVNLDICVFDQRGFQLIRSQTFITFLYMCPLKFRIVWPIVKKIFNKAKKKSPGNCRPQISFIGKDLGFEDVDSPNVRECLDSHSQPLTTRTLRNWSYSVPTTRKKKLRLKERGVSQRKF